MKIYLDDYRTPIDEDFILVKNYDEFVAKIEEIGLKNITYISLDHDLGDIAMEEYFRNGKEGDFLDYNNVKEKTGLDCAKWLIEQWIEQKATPIKVDSHSANPPGRQNIISLLNNFYKTIELPLISQQSHIKFK